MEKAGCTLMSNGWTNCRGRAIINFLANSRVGTSYLGSINCTVETKTGEYIAKGLASVIEKVGKDNVVQVCTDNASNYIMVGNILIFFGPLVRRMCWILHLRTLEGCQHTKTQSNEGRKLLVSSIQSPPCMLSDSSLMVKT